MERFKVTGAELRGFYQKNVNLAQIFSDIENDLRSENKVVCRYVVNGLEVSEADEVRFGSVLLDQIETLEYLTEGNNDVVKSVLRGWIESLPELIGRTETLSKKMRVMGFRGNMKSVSDLVQNCQFLIDSVVSLKILLGDQVMGGCPVEWTQAENESKRTVLEALYALESKNFVLLADVLEYDLNNVLQMWFENLSSLENIVLGKALNGELAGSNSQDGRCGRQSNRSGATVAQFSTEEVGSNIVGRKRFSN